ncbi:hypothetical protein SteCoe_7229 [Stentor coeruleus]|uniref:Uncharacterized protein n=1 Tax=Stentor coeruleus TaxID=5963 RepID=A0A1R2CN28_9CILI|nr:hypothetical protein SteCoe_7229 [Stentor coeruleus]
MSNSDFIRSLEKEIKRLSPSLSLSIRSGDPLGQILEIIKIAIDTLIEEKKSLESEYTRLSNESLPKAVSEDSREMVTSKSKILNAQKELAKIESLLRTKEKRLEVKEQDNLALSLKLTEEKRSLEHEKSQLESKTRELEIRIRALHEKENEFSSSTENFWDEKSALEKEKQSVFLLKQKTEENYSESERIKEMNLLAQENLQKALEKFDFEWKMLEEKVAAMNLKQDYIDKSHIDLERKKRIIEEERTKVLGEKENLIKIKQQISDERLNWFEEKQENDKSRRLNESIKSENKQAEISETKDLTKIYEKLKSQIEVYNIEISAKEFKINLQQQTVKKNTDKISKEFSNLALIHQSLQRTKSEIQQFNTQILPQIEEAFNEANNIVQTFKKKIIEIEMMEKKLSSYLLKVKETDNFVLKEKKVMFVSEKSCSRNESTVSNEVIDDITKELENKLKAVENREKELEAGIRENSKTAEYLKDLRKKMNLARNEIKEEKEKINLQVYQLEQGIKALTAKENEIQEYKLELDKRANLLKIKEKQLDLKLIKSRETESQHVIE